MSTPIVTIHYELLSTPTCQAVLVDKINFPERMNENKYLGTDHKCQLTKNLLSRLSCHPVSSYATVLVRKSDKFLTLELSMVADTCTQRPRQEDHKFEANLNFTLRLCLRNKRFLILLMIHNKYSNAFICLAGLLLRQYIFPST